MKCELSNKLYIHYVDYPCTWQKMIMKFLTVENPEYKEAKRAGRNYKYIKRHLHFYERYGNTLECPRGALRPILRILKEQGFSPTIADKRRSVPLPNPIAFQGELKSLQIPAVERCLKFDFGLLYAPTGSGKTVMALSIIAARKESTLIIVHSKELLYQWQDRIRSFLQIEPGIIGDSNFDLKPITIGMIQTVVKHAENLKQHFGHIVADECHRAPALTYATALSKFDSKYCLGLTATPERKDGLDYVIFWHTGPISGKIRKKDLIDSGSICRGEVIPVYTNFKSRTSTISYPKGLSELIKDKKRTALICKTIAENTHPGTKLILSDRTAHCFAIQKCLKDEYKIQAPMLTGTASTEAREKVIASILNGECKYIIATSQLIGEGFDLPSISSIFLTTPIAYKGRLIQYIGRALRIAENKEKALIYDFIDYKDVIFSASATKRMKVYEGEGLEIAKTKIAGREKGNDEAE